MDIKAIDGSNIPNASESEKVQETKIEQVFSKAFSDPQISKTFETLRKDMKGNTSQAAEDAAKFETAVLDKLQKDGVKIENPEDIHSGKDRPVEFLIYTMEMGVVPYALPTPKTGKEDQLSKT